MTVNDQLDKPVNNGLGETIGKIIAVREVKDGFELTMDVKLPIPLQAPLRQSFSIEVK